jgi:hypothetical protein
MKKRDHRLRFHPNLLHRVTGIVCSIATLSLGPSLTWSQQADSQVTTGTSPTAEEAPKIPNDQLDSLVAPIALYPDPLLAQALAACTYPLEIVQLQQWIERNKSLKDKELAAAVEKQNWDPSVQAMAAFPDVVQRLAGNIQWTTDLGNAFLARESDVMDAVQRMRAKAEGTGNLKTNAQQKVETQTVEGGKQVIVIQQANPKVVYVPSYDPVVVYGPPAYPYYPYSYPGYASGMALAFGTGLVLGAAWGGAWGWGCGWGRGDVKYNYGNKYVSHYNYNKNVNINVSNPNNINRPSQLPASGGGNWQHNPQHRGNAPYGDRKTADKFGGDARQTARDSRASAGAGAGRPGSGAGASTLPAGGANRPGGGAGTGNIGAGNRPGGGGATTLPANRPSGGAGGGNIGTGNRPGGGAGGGNIGAGNRPGGGGAGTASRPGGGGAGVATRPSGGASTRPAGGGGGGGGGGNRIGGHQPSMGGGSGAFGGGSGNSARASSNRGGQSMGGGGFSGGGGRGGGGRGGGGRGR